MTHEEWLRERMNGIGASEAAAIMGMSPYMTNEMLWEIKTGRRKAEDISGKSYVDYGTRAEQYLRALFALDYPEYKVGYKKYKIIRNSEHPFIFATLDGWLTEKHTGRKGVLEIKTTEIIKGTQRDKWKGRIPDNYYIQVLHQLLATGYEFVVLKGQLKFSYGELRLETLHYFIERRDVESDLEILKEAEIKFWECIVTDRRPNLILPPI